MGFVEAAPVHVVKEEGTLGKDNDDGDEGDMDSEWRYQYH